MSAAHAKQLRHMELAARAKWIAGLSCMLASASCSTSARDNESTEVGGKQASGGGSGSGGAVSSPSGGGGPVLSLGGGETAPNGGGGSGGTVTPAKTCDHSCSAVGKCVDLVCVVEENPGKLTSDQQTSLSKGGAEDPAFRWSYPYDKTVFPRGIQPITLQFEGGAADAWYVHISTQGFEYQGFFGAADPAQIKLSKEVWTALTNATGDSKTVTVQVSKLHGGAVAGPITESWTIAAGSLHGTLYYDNAQGIYQLRPGDDSDQQFLPEGNGVTVSADGSTLLTSVAPDYNVYDLKAGAKLIKTTKTDGLACEAFYPDGNLLMLFYPKATAGLFDPRTGTSVPKTGWPDMTDYACGAFSPDGSKLVYTDAKSSISVLDFDRTSKTFSNRQDFKANTTFSVFTPDALSVVFADGGGLSRLNLDTRQATRLAAAEGPGDNFAATMLPIAVGGYYWTVFSSWRRYGNTDIAQGLWVAALDMSAGANDSSHPAFYLDGQGTGVNRFSAWALEPCKADGSSCEFGDQCCGGFCRATDGEPLCLSTPPVERTCSADYEKCAHAADCCDKTHKCINNHCAAVIR